MERTGVNIAAALAAEEYAIMSVSRTMCEVTGPVDGFDGVLARVVCLVQAADVDVILQSADGARRMYRVRDGVLARATRSLAVVEILPSVHVNYVRPLRPREPRHTYYGIAPVGKGKWRATLCITNPTTHKKRVVIGPYVNTPVQAAVDHDRLARKYAECGMVGGRVHLNFAAGRELGK